MPKSNPSPKIGEVWYATLDPTTGREQAGFRPVLVVSNDWFNQLENSLVFIVPFTSRNRGIAYHVPVEAGNGGLPKDCVIMCEQLRSVDVSRLRKHQGVIEDSTLERVHEIIGMIFKDDPVLDPFRTH